MTVDIGDISLIVLSINVLLSVKIIKAKPSLKWFELSLIWALFIQISAKVMANVVGYNLPLLHLYTLFEFIFISLFYKKILFDNFKIKKYFIPFLAVTALLIIGNSIFLEPLKGFNGNAKGLTQFLIISYSISYFFDRISVEIRQDNLYLNRVNAAILLYYSGSLFIFIFANFLAEHSKLMNSYFWEFNAILYLAFQILVLLATWKIAFQKILGTRQK